MSTHNYNKAYTEIVEILKYVPDKDVKKIPNNMLEMFNAKKDVTYNFTINTTKSFEEQKLLEETEAILANIFRDYWATPYQKERILTKEFYDREQIEEEKRKQYNPDAIFKNKSKSHIISNTNEEIKNNLPIEIQKQSFFGKLINFIKRILRI